MSRERLIKEDLGERLFASINKLYPTMAGRITGMLLNHFPHSDFTEKVCRTLANCISRGPFLAPGLRHTLASCIFTFFY